VSLTPKESGKMFVIRYDVSRKEKGTYFNREKQLAAYSRSETLVPINDKFKTIATKAVEGRKSDLEKGRALYDYVLSQMKYDKSGDRWGRGDAVYACDVKTGNCTDFHALFIALVRSIKIPARFAIGFTIPTDKKEDAISGYHCWAEFLADGKWIPVDISEAWKEKASAETVAYYFGHHPSNRFEVSRGRDITPADKNEDGPINFAVHPYAEVNGKAIKMAGSYRFQRLN
jgi:transglutaminase-like putative cysteine protease